MYVNGQIIRCAIIDCDRTGFINIISPDSKASAGHRLKLPLGWSALLESNREEFVILCDNHTKHDEE